MALVLVTTNEFEAISKQWGVQCSGFGADLTEFAPVLLEHAKKIVSGNKPSEDYNIYAAEADGQFECILHVNLANLPGNQGLTQKVMWVLLAPKYDYAAPDPVIVAKVAMEIVYGAVELARQDGRSAHVKIHVGNIADRSFFAVAAANLQKSMGLQSAEMQGNWLHISFA